MAGRGWKKGRVGGGCGEPAWGCAPTENSSADPPPGLGCACQALLGALLERADCTQQPWGQGVGNDDAVGLLELKFPHLESGGQGFSGTEMGWAMPAVLIARWEFFFSLLFGKYLASCAPVLSDPGEAFIEIMRDTAHRAGPHAGHSPSQ